MQGELFEPPDPGHVPVEVDTGPVDAVDPTSLDVVTSLAMSPDRLLPDTIPDGLEELDALRTLFATVEARQFAVLAHLAATAPHPDQQALPGREVLLDLGGDGTPPVPEFLVVEIAALLRCPHTSVRGRIADALSIRWRHPRMWAAVMAGRLLVWQARRIAQAVRFAGLDRTQALRVDRALAPALGVVTWTRLEALMEGEIVKADPVAAAEREERARSGRFAQVQRDDIGQAGVRTVVARLATPEAVQLDATIGRLAHTLSLHGDTDTLDVRRSRALGILATPERACALLAGDTATADRLKPPVRLYLHLNGDGLDGDSPDPEGVVRLEGNGAVPLATLRALLADSTVRVTTVIDQRDSIPVDAYEIPDRIREQVVLAHPYEVFPWGSRRARHADLDHTVPYDRGGPTCRDNLGPLSRTGHRAKTHAGWRCHQIRPGHWLWRTPYGREYHVDNWGTHDLVPPEAIPSRTELEALAHLTRPPAPPVAAPPPRRKRRRPPRPPRPTRRRRR